MIFVSTSSRGTFSIVEDASESHYEIRESGYSQDGSKFERNTSHCLKSATIGLDRNGDGSRFTVEVKGSRAVDGIKEEKHLKIVLSPKQIVSIISGWKELVGVIDPNETEFHERQLEGAKAACFIPEEKA